MSQHISICASSFDRIGSPIPGDYYMSGVMSYLANRYFNSRCIVSGFFIFIIQCEIFNRSKSQRLVLTSRLPIHPQLFTI